VDRRVAPVERILFLAHTDGNGSLGAPALEALTGAVDTAGALGAGLQVGLFGGEVEAAADAIAGCGAERFLGVAGDDFSASRYSTDVAAAEALVRAADATIVISPATSRLARSLPGVAHRVGGRVDTRLTGLRVEAGGLRVQRWYYRQRMLATQTRAQRPWLLAVETGVFVPWQGEAGATGVEPVAVTLPDGARRTEVLGIEDAATDTQTIRPDAELLFVAGAGWTKKQRDGQSHGAEADALIRGFLAASKASLGSSKSLVEQTGEGQEVLRFMSHLNQVGQTGATPRHPKGLATCCHGEEPHVVGWRFITERRAVNLDPNCGWARGKTDVLYVADAFEVMAKVNALLQAEAAVRS
jgi:electron transfer flavoprotein alpha subunit